MTKALTDREDDYEALAKAIAIYNGNGVKGSPLFTAKSWPWLVRYMKYVKDSTRNSATVCHSCKYSINVRNKPNVLEGNLRSYVWYGGTYPSGDPRVGQEWCFAYGEKEWVAGIKYDDKQTEAIGSLDDPAVGRIDCVTGAPL